MTGMDVPLESQFTAFPFVGAIAPIRNVAKTVTRQKRIRIHISVAVWAGIEAESGLSESSLAEIGSIWYQTKLQVMSA
jgi:hypothetical protein